MRPLAILVDGELHLPNGECSSKAVVKPAPVEPNRAPTTDLLTEVDEAVACIANVVMLAQRMSADDARRVRAFVAAAHSLLCSTTSLDKSDQRAFEAALRDAARRN